MTRGARRAAQRRYYRAADRARRTPSKVARTLWAHELDRCKRPEYKDKMIFVIYPKRLFKLAKQRGHDLVRCFTHG